jgi:hypothetical protein
MLQRMFAHLEAVERGLIVIRIQDYQLCALKLCEILYLMVVVRIIQV